VSKVMVKVNIEKFRAVEIILPTRL